MPRNYNIAEINTHHTNYQ